MPSRIIRESALTSRTLNQLSDAAERMFWRLTLVADDHGRFDADPSVLLAKCFPLKVAAIRPVRIEKLRAELVAAGAIDLYEVDGRLLGHFPKWFDHQRSRPSKSKFPEPPNATAAGRGSPRAAANGGGPPQDAADRGDSPESAARASTRACAPGMEPREGGMEPRAVRREGPGDPPPAGGAEIVASLAKRKLLAPQGGNGARGDRFQGSLALSILRGWGLLAREYDLRSAELDQERDPRFCENLLARIREHPKPEDWSYMLEQIPKMPTCIGKGSPPPGQSEPWKISLQWIVASEDNWSRVFRRRWGD